MKPETRRARDPHALSTPAHRDLGETRTGRWIHVQDRGLRDGAAIVHAVRTDLVVDDPLPAFEALRPALESVNDPSARAAQDVGMDDAGRIHLLFDAADGQPIEDHCRARSLDWRARVGLVAQACDAVQSAHDRGVVHHGLEAANVLASGSSRHHDVRVLGFGVVTTLFGTQRSLTEAQASIEGDGIEFLAPEQTGATDLPLDSRADVYALGVLLHRILVGVAPHDASTLRRAARMGMLDWTYRDEPLRASDRFRLLRDGDALAHERATTGRDLERVLRDGFDHILSRTVARDPDARPESPAALARELRRVSAPAPSVRTWASAPFVSLWQGMRERLILRTA